MEWYIGCSGFHYKHWKNVFYPEGLPQKDWFNYYCRHFSTLELNVTFYRFPQLSFLQNWYDKSPANFRFSVKAPRAITHYKKFNNVTDLISSFYSTINAGLKEKLGPVLFQMPPNFIYSEDKLERIIKNLDTSFLNVLEFRHPSWWRSEVYQALSTKNITFCGMSHPLLPDTVIQNTPVIYYRFHGVPNLYSSPYTVEDMNKVISAVRHNEQSWFYFNNDINASAITNAKQMIQLVR